MQTQINRIKQKLDHARTYGLTCFGSERHGFILNPTLTEHDIVDFEQNHGICLPQEYRQFLLQLGNGGAGPSYGMLRLKYYDVVRLPYWDDDEVVEADLTYLAKPYLFDGRISELPDAVVEYYRSWDEETSNPAYQGAIAICHEGCTMRCWWLQGACADGLCMSI